jgi:hypothetical protein
MPAVDSDFFERFETNLKFHQAGFLKLARKNYVALLEFLQSIENRNVVIHFDQLLLHLIKISEGELSRSNLAYSLMLTALADIKDDACSISSLTVKRLLMEIMKASNPGEFFEFPQSLRNPEKIKSYILKLIEWEGRLGNNLIQVANALSVAKKTESLLILPKHDHLKLDCLNHSISFLKSAPQGQWTDVFFSVNQSMGFTNTSLEKYEALQSLPDDFFNFTTDDSVQDSTLVIHLRSGDVFSGLLGNAYHQPPLNFYKKVIDDGNKLFYLYFKFL